MIVVSASRSRFRRPHRGAVIRASSSRAALAPSRRPPAAAECHVPPAGPLTTARGTRRVSMGIRHRGADGEVPRAAPRWGKLTLPTMSSANMGAAHFASLTPHDVTRLPERTGHPGSSGARCHASSGARSGATRGTPWAPSRQLAGRELRRHPRCSRCPRTSRRCRPWRKCGSFRVRDPPIPPERPLPR